MEKKVRYCFFLILAALLITACSNSSDYYKDGGKEEVIEEESPSETSSNITEASAEEYVLEALRDRWTEFSVMSNGIENRAGVDYFVIEAFGDNSTHKANLGWFYVDAITGDIYELDMVTDEFKEIKKQKTVAKSKDNNIVQDNNEKESPLKLVGQGKIDGLDYGLGTPSKEIVKKWGTPDNDGYIYGGYYLVYDNVVFFNDGGHYDEGKIEMIAVTKGRELFGVAIGMTLSEIKEKLGKPTFERFNEDYGEGDGNNWSIGYEVGNYVLQFYTDDKSIGTNYADIKNKNKAY